MKLSEYIRKQFSRFGKKTLRKNIHNYISKKKDICCEDEVDREVIIDNIFELYSHSLDDSIETLHSDFCKFIGYKASLKSSNDKKGLDLWNQIDKSGYKGEEIDENEIKKALHDVPLYFLLAFLGYGYYKFKDVREPVVEPETVKMDTLEKSFTPSVTPEESPLVTPSRTPTV